MKKLIRDLFLIVIGALFYSLALTFLAMPNQLAEGGVPGVALILYYAFSWSPALTTFILNAVILVIGYRVLPRRTLLLSILTTPLISFFIFLTEGRIEPLGDPLVSAIFAGIFIGVGMGLIFRAGSALGGSTLIAKILNHNLGWDLTGTNFVLEVLVVLSGLVVIGPLHTMYTVVALFVGKKSADFIIEGLDTKKAVSVVSDHATDIADEILRETKMNVTVFKGYGGYSKDTKKMVYIVINKYQLFHLKQVVSSVDDEAFVIIYDVRDVFGGSFSL